MGTHYLGLSLFIILLSFFLILNGIAGFDDKKSQSIMASVDFAFSSDLIGEEKDPRYQGAPDVQHKRGQIFQDINAAFSSQIRNFEAKKTRNGRKMLVTIELDEFQSLIDDVASDGISEQSAAEKGSGDFLKTLVSLLQTGMDNVPYRMDMTIEVGRQDYTLEAIGNATERIVSITTTLTQAGLPQMLLSAGVRDGRSNVVELVFQPAAQGTAEKQVLEP